MPRHPFPAASCLMFAAVLAATPSYSLAAYEAPNPAYAAPAAYYNTANTTGTAAQLRSSLSTIISTGATNVTYGEARYAFAATDADPNNPNNIRLVYTDASVSHTWDNGVTFSREHMCPVSWLGTSDPSNSYSGIESDLFELRPVNPSTNSSRSNNGYGPATTTGLCGYPTGSQLWYPGNIDAGEVARSMFYMATRYYTGAAQPSISNLQLVNGQPAAGSFQIGDLASLLKANYARGVDNFERHRNQVIYAGGTDSLGAQFKQGNRNPFIDHPEYVWAVFGGGNNNSQIHLGTAGSTDTATGASALTNNQRVIRGSTLAAYSFSVTKDNPNPTTYDLTATSGLSVTDTNGSALGTGQTFDYNNVTRNLSASFSADAITTIGLKTATVTVHNTDLTTSGSGHGSSDGDDLVTLNATVLDHAKASFSGLTAQSSATLNFGTIQAKNGKITIPINIYNIAATNPNFTANLDLDSTLSSSGATSLFSTTFAPTVNILAGTYDTFYATLDPTRAGTGAFTASYTFGTSDEAILGGYAPNSQPITLYLTGTILSAPEPASLSLLLLSGTLLLRRRKAATPSTT